MRFFRLVRPNASLLVLAVSIAFAAVASCSEDSSTAECPTIPAGYMQAGRELDTYYLEAGIDREASYELEDYSHIYNVSTQAWVQGVDPASPERRWVEILLQLKEAEGAGCITYPYPPAYTTSSTSSAGAPGTP